MGYLGLYGPAFYAKDFKHNILSVSVLCDSACIPQFTQDPDKPIEECLRVDRSDFRSLFFQRAGGFYLCDFPIDWHNPLNDLVLPLPSPRMGAYPAIDS